MSASATGFSQDGVTAGESHAAVTGRLGAPGNETAVALPRDPGGLRVDRVEVMQHRLDRGAEAIDIEPVEARLAVRVGDCGVDLLQAVEELRNLAVAPHPGREASEGGLWQHGPGQAAHIGFVDRSVRPVGFHRNDVEAVAVDQPLGDPRPRLVELGRAVGCLAKQDDAAVAEPFDKIAKLVQIAERLSGFCHEPAHAIVDGERALRRQKQSGGEARGLGIDRRFLDTLALTFRFSPALLPDQGHENHGAEILLLEAILASAANTQQRLKAEGPDRDDQPSANRKLLLKRFGNLRATGGNDDGLEGCLLGQALGAIGDDDFGIGIAQPFQPGAGKLGELFMALDGEHLVGHAAHHRRGIA